MAPIPRRIPPEGLKLSPKTVSTYRARVFDKLDVTSDVELMRVAMRYGVV